MRDVMVSLDRQGVECLAVVHKHERSFRSTDDLLGIGANQFHVIQAGTWFRFLYTPFSPMFPVLMNRFLRRHKPDVLHLHMPNPSAFWALLLASASQIPWVVHWHADVVVSDLDPRLRWFYHLYRPLEQRLLRRAKAIIVTSKAYLDYSKPLTAHVNKCHIVPLGLETSQFPVPEKSEAGNPEIKEQRFRVLAVGRLTYYKGFDYLIRAAAFLPNVLIEIVGTGDQLKKLALLVDKFVVQDRVHLLGTLSDKELQERMIACDCLCLPSIERTEAFGMVLLEAMVHGKATVVSDVQGSGMGWIVEHKSTGLKVKPADVNAIVEAVKYLQENPEETRAMGMRGRERFEEMFQIDRSTASLVAIYDQVTKGSATKDV